MIVICKSCETKYDIKDEVIPEQGAQLKCAKCEDMIFVTKELSDSDQVNTEPIQENNAGEVNEFSDFDERPTILAPSSFHEDLKKESEVEKKVEEDDDSSSKSALSPNFLSESHDNGPSFDEVFDDFENEVSNESGKKTYLEENKAKLEEEPKAKVKKDSIDNALDGFFDDLTSNIEKDTSLNKPKEDTLEVEPEKSDSLEDTSSPDETNIEVDNVNISEDILIDDEETVDVSTQSETFTSNDDETQEISTMEMNNLKEKLKDGLNDSDFIQVNNPSEANTHLKSNSKIYVKLEDGPAIEFQIEKDMIDWLKAKSSLSGILYSLDNIDFSPILNHQLFLDVQEIIKKGQGDDSSIISASSILERGKVKPKANLTPFVLLLGVLIIFLVVYLLHLSNVMKLSFLDSITPEPKTIIEKHTEYKDATTKVKIKKIKKGKDASTATSPDKKAEGKDDSTATSPDKKAEDKKVEKTDTPPVKEGVDKKVETIEVYKIPAKEKRAYYKKARLASKAKNATETKKRYLTIAYNYPKEAEAYGVLYGVLRKDKRDKKYASLFIKAYKALSDKKENTTVTKALIKDLLK